ncbi:T9SS type A sorting domain-containing protein [Flavobacterium sp. I3-2]|uniref:T9SS type A sorting domain-containing protein n=1 Tax=Flavobacterium sp. I3-2 TaxID=2748319 RepID=UPI0015A7A9F1|nr:T9SS type A sorting domain-containing protein [Flavobacterium sp. I3-2]
MLPLTTFAQTTAIPDQQFEQALINLGIDSDNTLNGMILTADAAAVTPSLDLGSGLLNISFNPDLILNLTGINAFTNIQNLNLHSRRLDNGLDISNLSGLTSINLNNCSLNTISFAGNNALQFLEIGNINDLAGYNSITDLDFSTNLNIKVIAASNMSTLQRINLNNGQNINKPEMMISVGQTVGNNPNAVCIQVDDVTAALNNLAPYNTWMVTGNYFYSDNCALSVDKFVKDNIKVYPNPTSDYVSITQSNNELEVKSVLILDVTGKYLETVASNFENISMKNFASGVYLFVIHTNKGSVTNKIIVK